MNDNKDCHQNRYPLFTAGLMWGPLSESDCSSYHSFHKQFLPSFTDKFEYKCYCCNDFKISTAVIQLSLSTKTVPLVEA